MNNSFNSYTNRRVFMLQTVAASGLSYFATKTHAAFVEESNSQALALGYKEDISKIDKIKYPKYTVGQRCGTCALFKGSVGSVEGSCPLFAGKQVRANSWCAAYVKSSTNTSSNSPPVSENYLPPPVTQQKQTGFDDAKAKCADLGFDIGTEKFGNCVLKLTK